jgi:hypothetical protein
MDTGEFTLAGIAAALLLFVAIGAILLVQAMLQERRSGRAGATPEARLGIRHAMSRYIGPVHPDLALLNPPARVVLEFVAALCGFPGFGWLVSTRMAVGLPLLILGSATVYGFYPAFLALSGHFTDRPLIALEYLPAVAVASATALAVAEVRRARSARDAAQH